MRKSSLLLAALLLSGTAAHAETIAVSTTNLDKFKTMLLNGIVDAGKARPGVKVLTANADGDAKQQVADIRKFAADKVDAIIVAMSDGDMGPEISKIGADAGIPVVYVNTEPSNLADLPERQAVVASDEKESGTLQTQEVCRRLKGKGDVVVLMGELFHGAARQRTLDILDVTATPACKELRIVERQSANWSLKQADAQVQEWLSAGVKFDAVIANNDEMALGAIQAMKRQGIAPSDVVVAGIDATDDALAAMVAGTLDVTVLQNAAGQGAGAIDAALALAKGQKIAKVNYIPFELVTPENVSRYLPQSQ